MQCRGTVLWCRVKCCRQIFLEQVIWTGSSSLRAPAMPGSFLLKPAQGAPHSRFERSRCPGATLNAEGTPGSQSERQWGASEPFWTFRRVPERHLDRPRAYLGTTFKAQMAAWEPPRAFWKRLKVICVDFVTVECCLTPEFAFSDFAVVACF